MVFKVEMHYPSGQIEMLDQTFETLEQAVHAGKELIVQVEANEGFYDYKDNGLGRSKKQKAHFYVLKVEGHNKEEVYSSK